MAIAGGNGHSLAIRSDGVVFAAGFNMNGELGDNTTTAHSTFAQVVGVSNAVALCAGNISRALRSDGILFSTGWGQYGNLADNAVTARSTYVQSFGP